MRRIVCIGSHRRGGQSPLELFPWTNAGIGPLRKKTCPKLWIGQAVSRASVGDLASVEGVISALAQAIYDHFHEGS